MFDLTRLRTLNIDGLGPWKIFRLRQDLHAEDGRVCSAGTEFRFEYAIVNLAARRAEIHGLDEEDREVVFESLNNAHRDWFENTGREWRPGPREGSMAAIAPPPAGQEQAWLAAQPGFEEASEILKGKRGTENWGSARADADVLRWAALRLAKSGQPAMAGWLADRSLDFYHSWMAQATSGGEGKAMEDSVRDDLRAMRALIDTSS